MKSIFLLLVLSYPSLTSLAQWNINAPTVYNTNTGNVAIGPGTAVTPLSKLHIFDGNGGEQLRFSRGAASVRFVQGSGLDNLYLYNRDATKLFMFWKENGNVGINHETPEGKLHVRGCAYFGNENTDSYFRVSVGGSGGDYGSVGYGYKYSLTTNEHTYAVNDFASQLRFDVGGFNFFTAPTGAPGASVSFTPVVTIKQNGAVGIGTINPDAKLAVKGTVHAQEVKVDLNVPAPDYVFEETYNLRSLEEVEAYISQNKHLPEVPAAKEMENNGVNLGEMNMLLLKKVEELTLYLLYQAKEIDSFKQRLKVLEQGK